MLLETLQRSLEATSIKVTQQNYDSPAENSKHEVHDEERPDNDKADEVDPRPTDTDGIVDLEINQHSLCKVPITAKTYFLLSMTK